MHIAGRRYETGELISLNISGTSLKSISQQVNQSNVEQVWVAPGLVDLQINGCDGIDFADPSFELPQALAITRQLSRTGITQYLPTITTNSIDGLQISMRQLAKAFTASPGFAAQAVGIHLEGPYISPEDGPRGAHPKKHCRPPDWKEFAELQELSGNRIRLVTLSPEYENSAMFIQRAVKHNVKVAIGHTNANSQQIADAVSAGASLSTHLGNGAHALIRRHPNYIWDQLANDKLYASLIADGHHLPPSVVKSFVRAKKKKRVILVSDLTWLAGKPPGIYANTVLGDVEVLESGKLVVAGQRDYLAGATTSLINCVSLAAEFAEIDLATAINMASLHAQKMMGWRRTNFKAGTRADLILYRLNETASPAHRLELLATVCAGQIVYQNEQHAELLARAIST